MIGGEQPMGSPWQALPEFANGACLWRFVAAVEHEGRQTVARRQRRNYQQRGANRAK